MKGPINYIIFHLKILNKKQLFQINPANIFPSNLKKIINIFIVDVFSLIRNYLLVVFSEPNFFI